MTSLSVFNLSLDGLPRSKKNSRITDRRTGRSFPSPEYRKWFKDSLALARKAVIPSQAFTKADIYILFGFDDLRVHDIDNMTTSVLDFIKDIKVIEDDKWTSIGLPHVSFTDSEKSFTKIMVTSGNKRVDEVIDAIKKRRAAVKKVGTKRRAGAGTPEKPEVHP
jgi:Holliday junction resolvase RusA-like endonuclease